jgi:hypothetical protein
VSSIIAPLASGEVVDVVVVADRSWAAHGGLRPVRLAVSEPCQASTQLPSSPGNEVWQGTCDEASCGHDACGVPCGRCSEPDFCDAFNHTCLPTAPEACAAEVWPTGLCDPPGFICDPDGCSDTPCAPCAWRVCVGNVDTGRSYWRHASRELSPSCVLAGCPVLPVTMPCEWSSDFTSARASVPLDATTGDCLPEGQAALSFGLGAHSNFMVGDNGWVIEASSAGIVSPQGVAMDTPTYTPFTLRVRSPLQQRFELLLTWLSGPSLRIDRIEPVSGE